MRFAICVAFMLPFATFARANYADDMTDAQTLYDQGFRLWSNAHTSVASQTSASNNSQELRVLQAMHEADINLPGVTATLTFDPKTSQDPPAESDNTSLNYIEHLIENAIKAQTILTDFDEKVNRKTFFSKFDDTLDLDLLQVGVHNATVGAKTMIQANLHFLQICAAVLSNCNVLTVGVPLGF